MPRIVSDEQILSCPRESFSGACKALFFLQRLRQASEKQPMLRSGSRQDAIGACDQIALQQFGLGVAAAIPLEAGEVAHEDQNVQIIWPEHFAFDRKHALIVPLRLISSQELYVSDGTPAGTHPLKDLGPGVILEYANCLTVEGNKLYFNANGSDGRGFGPWIGDGTDAGTQDINPGGGIGNGHCLDRQPGFANAGNEVLFNGRDPSRGRELFRSDGTAAGTALVRDIVPGAEDADPQRFVSLGGRARFTVLQSAKFNLEDEEPWCSDGTAQGTLPLGDLNPGSDSSQPRSLTRVGPWLVFSAVSPPLLDRRLWRSDSTSAGTVPLLPNLN